MKDGYDKIEKKIEEIAQMKDDEEAERYYNKYSAIFDLCFKFLSKKKVLLYGGMAINELLPEKLKIYKHATIPDIDIFSTHALEVAKNMVVYFQKKGYSHISTSFTEALHQNTYKVYVDSVQVADITNVSPKAFKRLSENSVMAGSFKLRVVNPQFLRMSLHLIMSKGDADSVHRWGKVLHRLFAFYKAYPPSPCKLSTYTDTPTGQGQAQAPHSSQHGKISQNVKDALYHVLKTTDYVLFGMHEVEIILEKTLSSRMFDAYTQLFVNDSNLTEVATQLIHRVVDEQLNIEENMSTREKELKHFKVSKVYDSDEFVPAHVIISYKGEHLMTLFQANECIGFVEYNGYRIASLHTVIRMYMSFILSSYSHFHNHVHSLECLANVLTLKQMKMNGAHKKLLQDVVGQCYGTNTGLITMRKERLIRIAKKNK